MNSENLSIKQILKLEPKNQNVVIKGWIRTKREAKDLCFLEINDGSIIKNIQVIITDKNSDYKQLVSKINTGSSVIVEGTLVPSQGKNQLVEVIATDIKIIGDADPLEYPLQKKKHSFEFLREIAHLRPRTNTFGAIARLRSELSYAIHTFFRERGFIYIHTPLITASDCEGAGEMFRVTTLDMENLPKINNRVDYSKDFFGKEAFLTVSGQLNGEIYACALNKIYTFGPTFRAEHSNTTRHLAEFWMIEPEMAFCDINQNMDIAEEFLKYLFNHILINCKEDLLFFNERIDNTVISNLENIIKEKFERITYTEAIKILKDSKKEFEYPVEWGVNLQAEHEKFLTEVVFKKPVIVTDYPKEIKAFYMKLNDDNKTVRAMDILVPKLGEIIGGSEREDNYDKLLKRIRELGLKEENYWWYLELRKFGTVPHSGFGLGFERLVQYISGMQNIRDVIPFPRTYKTINF